MRYTHFRILILIVWVSFCLIFCNFGKRHVDNSSRIHISEVQSFTQVHVEYVEILSVGIVRRKPKSTLVRLRAAPKISAKSGTICICARYAPRGDFLGWFGAHSKYVFKVYFQDGLCWFEPFVRNDTFFVEYEYFGQSDRVSLAWFASRATQPVFQDGLFSRRAFAAFIDVDKAFPCLRSV